MSDSERRKLSDLKVADLRFELEKRELDRTGVKTVLIERLHKALESEGHDPDTYLFEQTQTSDQKTVPKKKAEGDASEAVKGSNNKVPVAEEKTEPEKEKLEVKIEETNKENKKEIKPVKDIVNEEKETVIKEEKEESASDNVAEKKKKDVSAKEEKKTTDSEEKAPARNKTVQQKEKTVKDKEIKKEDKSGAEVANSVIDNEDSINLTIGEDEEKLLAEEDDCSQEKKKKDEVKQAAVLQSSKVADKKSSQSAAASATKSQPAKRSNEDKEDGKSSTSDDKQKAKEENKSGNATSNLGSGRNLWVRGLSSTTRATDIKQFFSKFGKVVGAKVVTNTRTPGARCYGYVTMSTSEEATRLLKCDLTVLHGQRISIEKVPAKGDSASLFWSGKKGEPKLGSPTKAYGEERKKINSSPKKQDRKEEKLVPPGTEEMDADNEESKARKEPVAPGTEDSIERIKNDFDANGGSEDLNSDDGTSRQRNRSRGKSSTKSNTNIKSFKEIKDEQEKRRKDKIEKLKLELREEENIDRRVLEKKKEMYRLQTEETNRLRREREKLRREREKLERERAELLKMEREHQRLERERLEREKDELKRQQIKLEEERRGTKRTLASESVDNHYEDSRKRSARSPPERRYESHRFEDDHRKRSRPESIDHNRKKTIFRSENFKKSESLNRKNELDIGHSRSRYDMRHEDHREDSSKDRFDHRSSSFRSREEQRPPKEHHTRDRYEVKGDGDRFRDRGGDSWHSAGGGVTSGNLKSYGGSVVVPQGHGREMWVTERKPEPQQWPRPHGSTERWVSAAPINVGVRAPQVMVPNMYQNSGPTMSGMPMVMSSGGYGGGRFDAYKPQQMMPAPMGRKF